MQEETREEEQAKEEFDSKDFVKRYAEARRDSVPHKGEFLTWLIERIFRRD